MTFLPVDRSGLPPIGLRSSRTRGMLAERFLRRIPDYLAPEGTAERRLQRVVLRRLRDGDDHGTRDRHAAVIRAIRRVGVEVCGLSLPS